MTEEINKRYDRESTIDSEQHQQTNFDIDVEKANSLSIRDLQKWYIQARQLRRSQEYLDRINRIIDYAAKNPDKLAISNTKSLENAMLRDKEELRRFKARKKKQDEFPENFVQPSVNNNLQNQQHLDRQYKFDRDVEETKSHQNNQSLYTTPKYSAQKSNYYDYLNKRFVRRASDDYQMQSGRNQVGETTEHGVDMDVIYGIECRKEEAEIKAQEISEKTGKPYRMNVRALATKIHHQTEANAQTIKQEKYRAWKESQSQKGIVKVKLEDLEKIQGQPLLADDNPQQKIKMSFKKYAELLDKLEEKTRHHIYEKIESETKKKYENNQYSKKRGRCLR